MYRIRPDSKTTLPPTRFSLGKEGSFLQDTPDLKFTSPGGFHCLSRPCSRESRRKNSLHPRRGRWEGDPGGATSDSSLDLLSSSGTNTHTDTHTHRHTHTHARTHTHVPPFSAFRTQGQVLRGPVGGKLSLQLPSGKLTGLPQTAVDRSRSPARGCKNPAGAVAPPTSPNGSRHCRPRPTS